MAKHKYLELVPITKKKRRRLINYDKLNPEELFWLDTLYHIAVNYLSRGFFTDLCDPVPSIFIHNFKKDKKEIENLLDEIILKNVNEGVKNE